VGEVTRAVLDTNILIAGPPSFDLGGNYKLAVTSLSLAELRYGINKPGIAPEQKAARQKRLAELEQMFAPGIPFDHNAAISYGIITEFVERSGRKVRGRAIDLLIAAVAHANNAAIVTLNPADFKPLETVLEIKNPLTR
jgi:predicted nucleic acid-binding protein